MATGRKKITASILVEGVRKRSHNLRNFRTETVIIVVGSRPHTVTHMQWCYTTRRTLCPNGGRWLCAHRVCNGATSIPAFNHPSTRILRSAFTQSLQLL